MRISFPHMGTSHIAIKHLLKNLGYEVISPPPPSSKTLDLGVRYSPEFACIPFKVLLGTYMEVLEAGVDTIITTGGVGPCRAGIYAMLQKRILEDLGYDFEMIVLEPPQGKVTDFFGKIKKIVKGNHLSWRQFWFEFRTAWEKLNVLDDMEILSHQVRPYELKKGETTRNFQECLRIIDEAQTREEIQDAKATCTRMLTGIPRKTSHDPLKIGIIGEIYVVLEPFMNLDVEITLGEMGVATHRSIYLTQWTRQNAIVNTEGSIREIAYPYLPRMI